MKKVNIIFSIWVEKFVGVLFCGLAYITDIEDQIFVLQSEWNFRREQIIIIIIFFSSSRTSTRKLHIAGNSTLCILYPSLLATENMFS